MPAQAASAASCWVLDPHTVSWPDRITQLDRGWSLSSQPLTSSWLFIAARAGWSEERRYQLAVSLYGGISRGPGLVCNGDISTHLY